MAPDALTIAERTRTEVISATEESVRAGYSQYLTPYQTAELAASMFSDSNSSKPLRCLDLGSGTGILPVALAERYSNQISVDCIELDPKLSKVCDEQLSELGIKHSIRTEDALETSIDPIYDRVILNPPYRKMASNDPRQKNLPVKSPNLYSAFMMIALKALAPEGECVAIVPRSWTNGKYFEPFRRWALSNFSLDAIHIYGSRTEIFSDTDVLQETMIVRFSRRPQSQNIQVSDSQNKGGKLNFYEYRSEDLIDPDHNYVIRISSSEQSFLNNLRSLGSSGLCTSTGKVVEFRCREFLKSDYEPGLNRLIYPRNFTEEGFKHPVEDKKPQWIDCPSEKTSKVLIPAGSYVVVKRCSSKEEPRRIKAYVLDLKEPQALENHLNYIHAGTPRNTVALNPVIAKGLTLWLSSTPIDTWFRSRSGSTQVNASDLNDVPVPSKEQLLELGKHRAKKLNQEEVDSICKSIVF